MIHLGIDFGTANTRISVYHGETLPEPLRIGSSGSSSPYMMPSVCWIDRSGDIVVGEHALAQPNRLNFIKRYWQDHAEDTWNPWKGGKIQVDGREYTCEQMIECVIAEALSRAFNEIGRNALRAGVSANVVCPVNFDRTRRLQLADMLTRRGIRNVSLNNVIDEPLAAAVLYGRLETIPPTKLDLLVFDVGAGTSDAAVVRYEEDATGKRMTVLAEQGRCSAGSDLDRATEELVLSKLAAAVPGTDLLAVYRGYSSTPELGKVAFEADCEQIKIAMGVNETFPFSKTEFLGKHAVQFEIAQEEFKKRALPVLNQLEALVKSVLTEAANFVEDFAGVDLVVLVGGTSKLPMVANVVTRHCNGATVISSTVLDQMLATVRGVGFEKDFRDLVLKRPPYSTEVRVRLNSGASHAIKINEAFEPFDWRLAYQTSIPYHRTERSFDSPIDTVELTFVSPNGELICPSEEEFPRNALKDAWVLNGCLDLRGKLKINHLELRAPYFSQVGLRAPKPYSRESLNLPEVYPAEN